MRLFHHAIRNGLRTVLASATLCGAALAQTGYNYPVADPGSATPYYQAPRVAPVAPALRSSARGPMGTQGAEAPAAPAYSQPTYAQPPYVPTGYPQPTYAPPPGYSPNVAPQPAYPQPGYAQPAPPVVPAYPAEGAYRDAGRPMAPPPSYAAAQPQPYQPAYPQFAPQAVLAQRESIPMNSAGAPVYSSGPIYSTSTGPVIQTVPTEPTFTAAPVMTGDGAAPLRPVEVIEGGNPYQDPGPMNPGAADCGCGQKGDYYCDRPFRTRGCDREPCPCPSDEVLAYYRCNFYGHYPTMWRPWPDGWTKYRPLFTQTQYDKFKAPEEGAALAPPFGGAGPNQGGFAPGAGPGAFGPGGGLPPAGPGGSRIDPELQRLLDSQQGQPGGVPPLPTPGTRPAAPNPGQPPIPEPELLNELNGFGQRQESAEPDAQRRGLMGRLGNAFSRRGETRTDSETRQAGYFR